MPRRTLRSLIAKAAYTTGLTQAVIGVGSRWTLRRTALPRKRTTDSFLVLVYHRVMDRPVPLSIDTVDTRNFRQQISYLARTFTICDLEEILTRIESGIPLPPRCASITFDDGYRDNFDHAFPVLRTFGLPATIFLTAGNIDRREPLWFDRVLSAFRATRLDWFRLPGLTPRPLGTLEQRWQAALHVLMELKNLDLNARAIRVASLQELLDVTPPDDADLLLEWKEVESMSHQGMSFGSHTMTHCTLSRASADQAHWELAESKSLIESHIGRPVRLFAYPHGKPEDVSADAAARVREAGYGLAFTTVSGANAVTDDRYLLRRISPWPSDLPSFALTLARALVDTAGATQ
jgi:peptidoglycan/xylan/chitin deacetylase (PgdA/CDA1 family)